MILLLASCGGGNKSADNIESAAEGDTIEVISEMQAGVQEEIDSEPVIRIDTIPLEETREALLISMAQDSAPEYNGGKYTHLRHMPDSLQNIIISHQIIYDPNYRQFISTSEWEIEINRIPDSDLLGYREYSDTTFYFLPDKFSIDIINKDTHNHIRRTINRDFALEEAQFSSEEKMVFIANYCRIQSITPDTVKISADYCLYDGAIVHEVIFSISKDGNLTIKRESYDN